jgi:hypothetical protein
MYGILNVLETAFPMNRSTAHSQDGDDLSRSWDRQCCLVLQISAVHVADRQDTPLPHARHLQWLSSSFLPLLSVVKRRIYICD